MKSIGLYCFDIQTITIGFIDFQKINFAQVQFSINFAKLSLKQVSRFKE